MAEQGIIDNHVHDEDEVTYCEKHPDRETALRCNRCNRLMCAECAVQTPVGYRCRECVRQVEDTFFTGTNTDYILGFGVSTVISAFGGFIAGFIPFWLAAIFIGILVGGFIGEVVLRVTKKRRGRYTAQFTAAGAVAGTLLVYFFTFIPVFTLLIYGGLVAFGVYGRFKV